MDLKPYLPVGTTLFLNVDAEQIDEALGVHEQKIGRRTVYGFGQVVIGCW
jgi:hypothetical protein